MEEKINKFFKDNENLDNLELDHDQIAIMRFPEAATYLTFKKLRLIVSRLLKCLEFDPEEFDKLLEAAEC